MIADHSTGTRESRLVGSGTIGANDWPKVKLADQGAFLIVG
jgi:hypothetical protein